MFGQHALAYAVLAYGAEYFRRRVLWFPLWQQAVQVAALLVLCALIVLLVRFVGGAPLPRWPYFVAAAGRRAAVAGGVACCCRRRSARRGRERGADGAEHRPPAVHVEARGFAAAARASAHPNCAIPSASCSSSAAGCRSSALLVFVAFCGLFGALLLPAGRPARALRDAGRDEPHRDRADRAQPRPDHRPQRRRARANYSAYTLEITPSRVKNLDETIDELAEIVDIQPRDRKRFQQAARGAKNFESLPIRTRLTDEEVARFAVNRYRFPGVEIKARLFRQYPFGEVASHVDRLHRPHQRQATTSASTSWDETANYKGTDYIGKVGVEQSYERELHGTTGFEEVEVDAGGRAVRTLSRTPPIAGQQPDAVARHRAAAGGRSGVRRPPRRAGRDRSRDRRRARVRVASRASIRTCSSTASTPRTGRS